MSIGDAFLGFAFACVVVGFLLTFILTPGGPVIKEHECRNPEDCALRNPHDER